MSVLSAGRGFHVQVLKIDVKLSIFIALLCLGSFSKQQLNAQTKEQASDATIKAVEGSPEKPKVAGPQQATAAEILTPEKELEASFKAADKNKDGQLTEVEFLFGQPETARRAAKRDLLVFDRDHDGKLTLPEFRNVPSRVPPTLRGTLPSPVAQLLEERMASIEKSWAKWDADQNGSLNEVEFQASELGRSIPIPASTTLKDWDRDADGGVTIKDCRWILEAALGLRRLDGQLLYHPTGKIVYWWHFKGLDTDHDEQVTEKEFLTQSSDSKSLQARFQIEDIDKNGGISFKEWAESPYHLFDPIVVFLLVDKNFDGQVDPLELRQGTDAWLRPLPDSVFPGFDLDADGKLSLDEYRGTLLMNRVENWLIPQQDLDKDGRLSPAEFSWAPGIELALLKAEYFRRLDVNRSGYLELNEIRFATDPAKVSPDILLEVSFKGADTDQDGNLAEVEFLFGLPEAAQRAAKRDLLVFDRDHDGKLTLAEFRNVPSRVPPTLRGTLPSPVAQLLEERMASIEKSWAKWDADQNGSLNEVEFKASNLGSSVPTPTPTTQKDWDRDADGGVTIKDCRWILEAAFGLRRLDGQLLYHPTGKIVYWWHFKGLDTDHDEQVTEKEFLTQGPDSKTLQAQFQIEDIDKSGGLSFKEWAEGPYHLFDPIEVFLFVDKNFDGQVDQTELQQGTDAWLRPLPDSVFPGFDLDANGTLSLDEYRHTLLMNRMENWLTAQPDIDLDGKLRPSEFAWTPGIELALLKAEYFRRLDVNHDGFLELNEFRFATDISKVAPAIVVQQSFNGADLDRDGQLGETEFLGSVPEANRPAAKRDLLVFDADHDGKLTVAEFRNVPSRVPPTARGVLSSPFEAPLKEKLATIEKSWSKWDTDQNKSLSEAEFKASGLADSFRGLEQATWKDWDRDGDGSLSQKDCRWLLEAGFGLRRLDGQILYLPTGLIVYWWHFKGLDTNHNDSLTLEEFLKQGIDPKFLEGQFKNDDADHDGQLSFKEWAESSNHRVDPISDFLTIDKDLNGKVDAAELKRETPGWLKPLPDSVFPGFDLNGDGFLSLDEHRSTLISNRMEPWLAPQRDADFDGRLSLAEFTWTPGIELSLLKAEYFRRLDIDRSGYLELKEFSFLIDLSKVPPQFALEQLFQRADIDLDGQLSETEFVSVVPEANRPAAKRDLLVFDLDHDGKLTLAEFRNVPSRVPPALRGILPNPFAKLLEARMGPIEKNWAKWDTDQNGTLSHTEFQNSDMSRSIPGFALSTWGQWDRDGDGRLSQKDCLWLLEAAYGLRRLDGQLLHLPTGQIVYWWHFKGLDSNHNERVTREEFLKQSVDFKILDAQFKIDDADQNGEITFKEWSESPNHLFDPVAEFIAYDKNLDGQIDPAELNQGTAAWLQPLRKSIFPGFDLNADGNLSLDEFRTTLIMNRMENWLVPQQDIDSDGRLSPAEFAWMPGPELTLLKSEYFRRFDVNRSGYLDLGEFQFTVNPSKVPLKVMFQQRDRNEDGQLTIVETFGDLKPNPAVEYDAAYETLAVRIEEEFHKADTDRDETLSLEEFDTPQGRLVLAPDMSFKSGDFRSLKDPQAPGESRLWLIVAVVVNLLLVGGVVAHLLAKRAKS